MRVAIVEDELLALNYLKEILESQDVIGFSTITSLRSKKQAIEFFKENMVDLIFMDIHLGDGKSLGIFEEVELRTPVIFITAYDEYAIKVFRHFQNIQNTACRFFWFIGHTDQFFVISLTPFQKLDNSVKWLGIHTWIGIINFQECRK